MPNIVAPHDYANITKYVKKIYQMFKTRGGACQNGCILQIKIDEIVGNWADWVQKH